MTDREYVSAFSDYLFWDVAKNSIDLEKNAPYVIQRVLEYGQLNDWRLLVSRYGTPKIASISKMLRTLDSRALSFISAVSSTPKTEFRCYTTKR